MGRLRLVFEVKCGQIEIVLDCWSNKKRRELLQNFMGLFIQKCSKKMQGNVFGGFCPITSLFFSKTKDGSSCSQDPIPLGA